MPPPEPPRIVQGYRERLEDLEELLKSWETPSEEALGMIQLLRAELDDHDRRYAAGGGVEMVPGGGVRQRTPESEGGIEDVYTERPRPEVTEMSFMELFDMQHTHYVDDRTEFGPNARTLSPEDIEYREKLEAEIEKRRAHPDFGGGRGINFGAVGVSISVVPWYQFGTWLDTL